MVCFVDPLTVNTEARSEISEVEEFKADKMVDVHGSDKHKVLLIINK